MDVLIVDDSIAIRKILTRVLRSTKIPIESVWEAGDGLQGLEQLKAKPVQLILADINMPNMDGLEFLAKLKLVPEWKPIPIVMVTTEGSQDKVVEAMKLGASGYVRKPFTTEQLSDTLGKIFKQ